MLENNLIGLKFNHLRLIVAISEHGRISTAAEILSITQPAASRMLAEIEKILETKICNRHPKGMRLTLIGRALARRARNMLIEMQDLSQDIYELKTGRGGTARIGSVTGAAVRYVVPAIMQMKAVSPGVDLHVNVASSDVLIRDLLAGNYDFVLGRIPIGIDPHQFTVHRARKEHVDFLVRNDHPLSGSTDVNLSDLSSYEWVTQSRGAPIREAVEAAFRDCGAPLPTRITNTSSLLVTMAILTNSTAIAPIAKEVSDLLKNDAVSAKVHSLPVKEKVEIDPYYLITVKGRQLSQTANRLKELVNFELVKSEQSRKPER